MDPCDQPHDRLSLYADASRPPECDHPGWHLIGRWKAILHSRGTSFGTFFEDYTEVSDKPLVILEYGIYADGYRMLALIGVIK